MKHKRYADRLVGYDNNAPTAKYTLLLLSVAVVTFIHFTYVQAMEIPTPEQVKADHTAFEARLAAQKREANRQAFLTDLKGCESTDNDHAVGDGGDSVGGYQVQKTTLEDWLNRKISYSEYYSIVTNDARIRPLVYDAYFERGESWRWKVCTKKLTANRTWEF